jgi:hypothetical protein
VLKGKFASSVFHGCKEKTPKTRILVSGPQCVKIFVVMCAVSALMMKNATLSVGVIYARILFQCELSVSRPRNLVVTIALVV